jgi:hypothetical protein
MATDGPPPSYELPPLRVSVLRTILRVALIVAFAYGAHLLLIRVMNWTEALPHGMGSVLRIGILSGILLVYALLIAIPYVPGIEVGFSLIMMRGAEVAWHVYLATVLGLILAYLAGRFLPYAWLHRLFLDLRMTRACRMLDELQPLTPAQRLTLMKRRLPQRLGALAVRFRYVLLAALINMPGSALIGGGGGICLLAGLTRLFDWRATILTILLAVLPVPLTVWLWGPGLLNYLGLY